MTKVLRSILFCVFMLGVHPPLAASTQAPPGHVDRGADLAPDAHVDAVRAPQRYPGPHLGRSWIDAQVKRLNLAPEMHGRLADWLESQAEGDPALAESWEQFLLSLGDSEELSPVERDAVARILAEMEARLWTGVSTGPDLATIPSSVVDRAEGHPGVSVVLNPMDQPFPPSVNSPSPDFQLHASPEPGLVRMPSSVGAGVASSYDRWVRRWYDRQVEILEERREAFTWNARVSRAIFWVVHVVLMVGLVASVWEFFAASGIRREAQLLDDGLMNEEGMRADVSEIKISLEGVALKTALHGLLLLALSMGFYFMYLKFVYPIIEVGG